MDIKFDDSSFKELCEKLENKIDDLPELEKDIVQDIAYNFFEEVIQQTPESDNDLLKNSWKKRIIKKNNHYIAEIYNTMIYAWDVEYGHKMGDGRWKKGYFMKTITENMIRERMEEIGQKHVYKFLEDVFK